MSPRKPVVIIGAGGQAREIVDIFDAQRHLGEPVVVLGFLADPAYVTDRREVNGRPILGGIDWLASHAGSVDVICGVGDPCARWDLVRRAEEYRPSWIKAIHPSASITAWTEVARGAVVAAGAVLSNQVAIGAHAQVNVAASVAHDAVVEPFATIAPGARISGSVKVSEGAFIGTGAVVIEKRTVGPWSVVGAGSAVIRDVPADATVVGVPARVIKKREPGWQERR